MNAEQLRQAFGGRRDNALVHLDGSDKLVILTAEQARAIANCMEEANFPEFGDVVQIHEDEWFALLKAFGLKQ